MTCWDVMCEVVCMCGLCMWCDVVCMPVRYVLGGLMFGINVGGHGV